MARTVMIPTPMHYLAELTNVINFFLFGNFRENTPSSHGPWSIEELVRGAQVNVKFVMNSRPDASEMPFTLEATGDILYAVRMPLIMATKIQRAFREWKSRPEVAAMDGITASNDPEDMQELLERDAERMTTIYERSRATKIALKKTIIEKNKRIRQLKQELQEVHEAHELASRRNYLGYDESLFDDA
jgi:CheY-like chemotaxis protein